MEASSHQIQEYAWGTITEDLLVVDEVRNLLWTENCETIKVPLRTEHHLVSYSSHSTGQMNTKRAPRSSCSSHITVRHCHHQVNMEMSEVRALIWIACCRSQHNDEHMALWLCEEAWHLPTHTRKVEGPDLRVLFSNTQTSRGTVSGT